jgi:hypothetical protein
VLHDVAVNANCIKEKEIMGGICFENVYIYRLQTDPLWA